MISTRDLSALPAPDLLRRVMQSMAVLDAILCPGWQERYYSFNSQWAEGEQCGSMRNGSGDDLFALFNAHGCFLRGFAHEYETSPYRVDPPQLWPGMLDGLPDEFTACVTEPAFEVPTQTTFCIWRLFNDTEWRHGTVKLPAGNPDPDGSAFLLAAFDGRPETYRDWAEEYFGRDVDFEAVRAVYAHQPITTGIVVALDPARSSEELADDVAEIGYPARR